MRNTIFGDCSKIDRHKAPANERPERTRKHVRISSERATQVMAIFQQSLEERL